MYKEISDNFITNTITNYNALTDNINNQIEDVFSQLASDSELMQVASMPGHAYGDMPFGGLAHDIADVYTEFCRLKEQQLLDARAHIRNALEKQETMNRIMVCYNILPEEEHTALEYLYERFCFKEGLNQLVKDLDVSERTVMRRRTSAIRNIQKIYNSDLSNMELYTKVDKNLSKYR